MKFKKTLDLIVKDFIEATENASGEVHDIAKPSKLQGLASRDNVTPYSRDITRLVLMYLLII